MFESVIKNTDLSTLRENYSDPLCAMSHKQPTNPSFLSNVTDGFWRNKQMPLHPHPLTLPLSPPSLFVSTANFSPFCPFLWPSVVVGRPNMVGIHTRCWSRKADDIGNDIEGHIGLPHLCENRRFHDSLAILTVKCKVACILTHVLSV